MCLSEKNRPRSTKNWEAEEQEEQELGTPKLECLFMFIVNAECFHHKMAI
jgi:hypothetical protein